MSFAHRSLTIVITSLNGVSIISLGYSHDIVTYYQYVVITLSSFGCMMAITVTILYDMVTTTVITMKVKVIRTMVPVRDKPFVGEG